MDSADLTLQPKSTPAVKFEVPLDQLLQWCAEVRSDVADSIAELDPILAPGSGRPDTASEAARAEPIIWDHIDTLVTGLLREGVTSPSLADEDFVFKRVRAELFGLGGFEDYLFDPTVENVFVNGHDSVLISRSGADAPEAVPPIVESDTALIELVNRWAARLGRTERRFDMSNPQVDLRLPGGFRLHAIMEVSHRPCVTIRCPYNRRVALEDLAQLGTLDSPMVNFLRTAVKARLNIIVSGGTGTGKTTLLRALLHEVPPNERIITIEDTREIGLTEFPEEHPNVVELETRQANSEGVGGITMLELTRECLRMSPDRVVLGEVRGAEALYMLKAMSQGNDGSMCTLHSESAVGVVDRVRGYVAEGSTGLSTSVIDGFYRNAVDLVVQLRVLTDRQRIVTSIVEVQRDNDSGVRHNELFVSTGDELARQQMNPSPRLMDRMAMSSERVS